jgi:hypothetical protein
VTHANLPVLPLALLVLSGMLGCRERVTRLPYELVVRVHGDPEQPLSGARLMHGAKLLGISGADGAVRVKATGKEGERLDLQLVCPEGHRSPSEPVSLTLRRPAERHRKPEYFGVCAPLTRKLVVAVRAKKGANIPVRHLGRELARTDASGAAHVLLESAPQQTLELLLDTSEQPRLRPKNPTVRFRVGDRDQLVVLNQSFQASPVERPRSVRPSGPVRIR